MMYRPEHPNPQWERSNWRNLNGEWEFDFDFGNTALERKLYECEKLPLSIVVPFCPESDLSGIGYKDFISAVCYRKVITLSKEELAGKVFLHFGAVDYKSYIYVNGELVKKHIGGYSSFKADITSAIKEGENVIFVIAQDDLRSGEQPAGKQSSKFESYGCFYTRTTGIWQTVWLEFVPETYVKSAKYYPDAENGCLTVLGEVCGKGQVKITASYEGKEVASKVVKAGGGKFAVTLELSEMHLWEPGCGRLYDLEITFGEDRVKSYFGLRNVSLDNRYFYLNDKKVFQRFVLDQGFYPEGIYTAKSDEQLKKDIELSMAVGFNGARLHQKVFEKRFLYHCDKAGYMVWGEHANWGLDYTSPVGAENFICEWMEVVERDFNHPSIIGWCPFNESWGYYETRGKHRILETTYRVTKQMDETRPCIAISGNYHIDEMEIHDVHDYCNDFEVFKDNYLHIAEGYINDQVRRGEGDVQKYKNNPVFVSEYGGFRWVEKEEASQGWGYGDAPKTKEEFMDRYQKYTDVLLDNPDLMGYCYTQLYDVEQEMNGIYTYAREEKFDTEALKAINSRIAAAEKA